MQSTDDGPKLLRKLACYDLRRPLPPAAVAGAGYPGPASARGLLAAPLDPAPISARDGLPVSDASLRISGSFIDVPLPLGISLSGEFDSRPRHVSPHGTPPPDVSSGGDSSAVTECLAQLRARRAARGLRPSSGTSSTPATVSPDATPPMQPLETTGLLNPMRRSRSGLLGAARGTPSGGWTQAFGDFIVDVESPESSRASTPAPLR